MTPFSDGTLALVTRDGSLVSGGDPAGVMTPAGGTLTWVTPEGGLGAAMAGQGQGGVYIPYSVVSRNDVTWYTQKYSTYYTVVSEKIKLKDC